MRGTGTIARDEGQGRCAPTGCGRGVAPRQAVVELGRESPERITGLLVERRAEAGPGWIGAGEMARRLEVRRPWVYAHEELLGGIRLDDGPKAPWSAGGEEGERR